MSMKPSSHRKPRIAGVSGPPQVMEPALPPGLIADEVGQGYLEKVWWHLETNQRKFLIARTQVGSDDQAAKMIGLAHFTSDWKKSNPLFAAAYVAIRDNPIAVARAYLGTLAPKVVATLDEALEPGVEMRDRLKAAELALRANNMMSSQLKIETKTLTYEEKLLRFRLENGMEVPPAMLKAAMEEGLEVPTSMLGEIMKEETE